MNVEIGAEAALFPEKEYIKGFSLQCEYLDPDHVVGVAGSCRQFLGEVGVDIFFSGKDSSLLSLKSQKNSKNKISF
jgi:hypothetical protein